MLIKIKQTLEDVHNFRFVYLNAITSMLSDFARFGVIHPPAAAAAMVFASGNKTWAHMGIFLVAVCLSIVMSVTINNMSEKRQYPTSWPILRWISAFRTKNLKKGLTTQR